MDETEDYIEFLSWTQDIEGQIREWVRRLPVWRRGPKEISGYSIGQPFDTWSGDEAQSVQAFKEWVQTAEAYNRVVLEERDLGFTRSVFCSGMEGASIYTSLMAERDVPGQTGRTPLAACIILKPSRRTCLVYGTNEEGWSDSILDQRRQGTTPPDELAATGEGVVTQGLSYFETPGVPGRTYYQAAPDASDQAPDSDQRTRSPISQLLRRRRRTR